MLTLKLLPSAVDVLKMKSILGVGPRVKDSIVISAIQVYVFYCIDKYMLYSNLPSTYYGVCTICWLYDTSLCHCDDPFMFLRDYYLCK
jgi:hypothetical protein